MTNECPNCGRLETRCKCPQLLQEFEALCLPLMQWLKDNQDPHTTVIINDEKAEMVRGCYCVIPPKQ